MGKRSAGPRVGQIAHYVSYGTPGGEYTSQCRAAMITASGAWLTENVHTDYTAPPLDGDLRVVKQRWHSDAVALCALNPTGMFFNECPYRHPGNGPGGHPGGGTWHHLDDCENLT